MADLPEGFDLASLLAPVPGDQPAGTDLRKDHSPTSIYFRLRDARAEARDAEREAEAVGGEEDGAPGERRTGRELAAEALARWRTVQDLAGMALAGSSKDLEVAAWLTEALVRNAGLRGLAAGASVIAGLAERFWDDLYPRPDEDGMETRLAPVTGLSGRDRDGTLMQPLRRTTLFRRLDGEKEPFEYWRLRAGTVASDDFEREGRAAGPAHWSALRREIAGALAAWTAMSAALDARADGAGPSTRRVGELLSDIDAVTRRFTPSEDAAAGATASSPSLAAGLAGPDALPTAVARPEASAPVTTAGAISSREDAFSRLGEIAAWFKKAEPHSPLGYTLEEAVRRGRMSWIELLAELMPDASGRNAVLISLGIKPPPTDEESS